MPFLNQEDSVTNEGWRVCRKQISFITFLIIFCKIRIIRINFHQNTLGQNKIKFLGFNKSPYFCLESKIAEKE
jgi:hypothetical protein